MTPQETATKVLKMLDFAERYICMGAITVENLPWTREFGRSDEFSQVIVCYGRRLMACVNTRHNLAYVWWNGVKLFPPVYEDFYGPLVEKILGIIQKVHEGDPLPEYPQFTMLKVPRIIY